MGLGLAGLGVIRKKM
ncbi:MAG: hypothetical protein ACXU98_04100 [Syntrophales bacterium]